MVAPVFLIWFAAHVAPFRVVCGIPEFFADSFPHSVKINAPPFSDEQT